MACLDHIVCHDQLAGGWTTNWSDKPCTGDNPRECSYVSPCSSQQRSLVADLGDLAICLLHMLLSMKLHKPYDSFSPPSPPTHDSLSLQHLHILEGHLRSVYHLFFGLFLLKSNDKSDRGIISTVFASSHTNSNYTQTHRSMGHGLVS